jgi:hypothetical protein
MRAITKTSLFLSTFAAIVTSTAAQAGPIVFSASGATTTTVFNDFRTAIGGGSRIAWDGVRLDGTDANPNTRVIDNGKTVEIPIDRFRAVGAIYADPYAVSGDGFASVNPGSAGQFPAFSPNNTFAMFDDENGKFDDRFIEQTFVLPGTNTAAGTRGFGAIFVDVEKAGTSTIEYFGRTQAGQEVSLGKFDVPIGNTGEAQFLGVLFDAPIITEVVLTVGTHALFSFDGTSFQSFGSENGTDIDLAVTDDFVFATPVAAQFALPEPSTLALFAAAMPFGFRIANRRKGKSATLINAAA